MRGIFGVFLTLFFISPTLFAQTTVSGVINSDQIWSKANSPYIVEANVLVSADVTLTIEAGVTVKFEVDTYLRIDGIIIAEGDQDNYIVFEPFSDAAVKGSWEGIRLRGTSNTVINEDNQYVSGTKISYAKIKDASRGIYTYDNSVFISNSSFENNDKAIEIRATNKVILIESKFKENNVGIYSEYSDYSSGDDVNEIANTFIQKNHFSNNSSGINLNMNQRVFKNLKIQNNLFENNNTGLSFGGGGYGPRVADVTISNNVFNNKIGTIESVGLSVGQIYGGDSDFNEEGGVIKILHNLFKNAYLNYNYGGGVSGIDVKISNNIIDNSEGHDLVPAPYGIKISGGTSKSDTISNNYINSASYHFDLSDSYTDPSNKIFKDNTLESVVESTPDNSIYSIGVFGSGHKFESNNFLSPLNEKQFINKGTDNVIAKNNYWGTIDESIIGGLIYDYYDDFELGEVDYSNYLTAKNSSAPISPPINVEKTNIQGRIKITWTANTESDIAGYKIYYGNYTGYSFSNSIDIGNVTEYTLDLPVNYKDSVIAVTSYDIDIDGINDVTDGNESWYSVSVYNPIFYLEENNVTINCLDAEIGDTFEINGIIYTKRNIEQITNENSSTTCTSGIENMEGLFANDITFNEDISHWDVSNVKNMNGMFLGAESFNQDINNWDVSNVEDMNTMFHHASMFDKPLNNWNVSKVISMDGMFQNAESFNKNINNWDVSNVEGMNHMFASAKSFDQPLGDWDVSSVKTMNSMFASTPFNQDISGWDLENNLITDAMFAFNTEFNQDISEWNVSSVENMQIMFEGAISFNQPLNEWDVSTVTNMRGMFNGASSFNHPLEMWDVSSVTTMKNMFSNSSFNQDISKWDTRNVQNVDFMFFENNVFNQDISEWCVSKITEQPESFISTTSPLETLPEWGRCNEVVLYIPHLNSYSIDTTYTGVYQNVYSNSGYNSFQFSLFYDPDSINVEVLDIENDILKDFELVINQEEPGQIFIGGAGTKLVTEDGKLLNLKIDYKVGGESSIYLRDLIFDEGLFTGENSKNIINTEFLLCGDVTSDNTVSALDASHILRHTVRLSPQYPIEGKELISGDVTRNGLVTAYDAYFVLREVVGIGSGLRCNSTEYVLKDLWSPKLNLNEYYKDDNFVTSIHFSEVNQEVNSLELEVLNGSKLKVGGLPTDWNTIEYTREGTQYLSMYGFTPLINPELNWVQTPDQTLSVRVRVNESNWYTIEHELGLEEVLPQQYTLSQNYPNPFNPSTQIQYALPMETYVSLEVFNSVGQKVVELVNGQQSAGYHTTTFDASGLSSGVYLYKLTTPSFTQTRKMLLIK